MLPLLIFGHSNWSITEFSDHAVSIVCLALEDTSVGIVSLLNLAYNDGLKLTA
jgi:hypothetical protein